MTGFCHTLHTSMYPSNRSRRASRDVKEPFQVRGMGGTEARDTAPPPHGNGSLNGSGCERATVTVLCDRRKGSAVGLWVVRKRRTYPKRGEFGVSEEKTHPAKRRRDGPPANSSRSPFDSRRSLRVSALGSDASQTPQLRLGRAMLGASPLRVTPGKSDWGQPHSVGEARR